MIRVEEILQGKDIDVLGSGTCGQIKKLEINYYSIAGEQAIEAWQAVFKDANKTAIIVPENLNDGVVVSKNKNDIEKDLATYPQIDLERWLEERWTGYDFGNEEDELVDMMEEMGEEIPEPQPSHNFTIPYDILSQKPLDKLWLVDFTGIKSYEIPIYLQYGGWNANPMPNEQAAVLKYWHDKYGAELFGINNDVLEMYVRNPPTNYDEAHILAKEQMAYCDDIVFQGTMTVERLAQSLINSKSWYFWWD